MTRPTHPEFACEKCGFVHLDACPPVPRNRPPMSGVRSTSSELTERQRGVLAAIASFDNPPTFRELAARIGVASTNAVSEMLDRLEAVEMVTRPRSQAGNRCRVAAVVLTARGREAIGLPSVDLEERVATLESQVRSLQCAAPKGIDQ